MMASRPSRFPPTMLPRWTPSMIRALEETAALFYREADRSSPRPEWDSAALLVEWIKTNARAGKISPEGRERIAAAQRERWRRRAPDEEPAA